MIKLLQIENIAVIEKAEIEFAVGLNVLTGETGAGKSIVVDALSAVTGGRTSREIIRTGADYASVTAIFSEVDNNWLENCGIPQDESGDVYITRRISADGKSTCRANGLPVTAAQLKEFGAALLDVHGQNDGRKLLDEGAHLSYLDAFGGVQDALDTFRLAYKELNDKIAEIGKLTMDEREKERRVDTLVSQIAEIERAKLRPGEQAELSERRDLLLNAAKLTDAVESAFDALYGGESTTGAVALLSETQERIDWAARYSDGLRTLAERLKDVCYTVQDISDELRDFRTHLDFTPGELDEMEVRLDVLKRLARKYGSEEETLEYLEKSKATLSEIEDGAYRLDKLNREMSVLIKETESLAGKLSEMRKTASDALQKRVMDELSMLNMPDVRFLVKFDAVKGEYGLNASGCDEVCFLMSANAGEEPGRISRIASGGELARIMLALKNVLTEDMDTGAMVFDEIDTGVSGVAAQRVGEKLAKLARRRQILCVTHLPQIAVMADTHFEIQKSVSEGRTYTHVSHLDFEGRKNEIARLNGGENITETTLKSAAEQLAAAEEFKKCKM